MTVCGFGKSSADKKKNISNLRNSYTEHHEVVSAAAAGTWDWILYLITEKEFNKVSSGEEEVMISIFWTSWNFTNSLVNADCSDIPPF